MVTAIILKPVDLTLELTRRIKAHDDYLNARENGKRLILKSGKLDGKT